MRSIPYALAALVVAAATSAGAAALADQGPMAVAAAAWAAAAFVLVGLAFAGGWPGLLGKRADGRNRLAPRLVLAPYLVLNGLSLGLYRLTTRDRPTTCIDERLYLGRRLSPREALAFVKVRPALVLDLASEFAEVRALRELPGYRSLPLLDTTAPSADALRAAVAWITEAIAVGPVFVHGALGFGRSATVVLAYLLASGRVGTISEGLKLLQSLRPGVGLSRPQRRALTDFLAQLGPRPSPARD